MLSRAEAIDLVSARINETDLDWPTKPKHSVFEEMIEESDAGWIVYYGIPEDMRVAGRDPEPMDNPPWLVDRETGQLQLMDNP